MTGGLALEHEVAAIRALRGEADTLHSRRLRDRHFAALLRMLAPRTRFLVRSYGLHDQLEDAEQACAIAVHRAIELYDPARARFSTFVTWHLRGELQALRFRLRIDQRGWARKLGARTVSIAALGEDGAARMVSDDQALARVEAGAADWLARRTIEALIDACFGPASCQRGPVGARARERALLARNFFLSADAPPAVDASGGALSGERLRQATRRAIACLAAHVRGSTRFDRAAHPTAT